MGTVKNLKGILMDFEWAFGFNWGSLEFIGLYPGEIGSKGREQLSNIRVFAIMAVMTVFLLIPEIYAGTKVYRVLPYLVDNIITVSPVIVAIMKVFLLWIKRYELRQIYIVIRKDWKMALRAEWELEIMRQEARKGRFLTMVGLCFSGACLSGYTIGSVFQIDVRLINNITDHGNHHLLVQSCYPYDYSTSPIFELMNASQILAGSFASLCLIVPSLYFYNVILHASGQLRILAIRFEYYDFQQQDTRKSELCCGLIGRYSEIMKLIALLNSTFTYIVFSQLSLVYICAVCLSLDVLYVINSSEDWSLFQILALLLVLLFLLGFFNIDCYMSEYLNDCNNFVRSAIYNGNWYCNAVENKSYIIPILMYTARPVYLSAGKLFPLSRNFYCTVVNSIGGYVSILFAVYNKR